jgi:hypothetical protein
MPIFTLAVQSSVGKQRLGEVTAGTQLFRSVGGTVGTALLGGIMNSRLNSHMQLLKDEPFVAHMKQFTTGNNPTELNGTVIQGVLNPERQQHMRAAILKVSSPSAISDFNHFISSSKKAFSSAIDTVFLVAACLTVIALVFVFFLPEVPLRKAERPAMEEAGVMLEDELGQSDDENQPRLQEPEAGSRTK